VSLRRLPAIASLTLLIVLVMAAWRTPTVSAGFGPVSPEELQMTKESQAPGAAAIITLPVQRILPGPTNLVDRYKDTESLTRLCRPPPHKL
jgi:hypothetical protein